MSPLIKFLKNFFFLQNLAGWFASKIPVAIEHNIQKYGALKKAFYLTALEQLEGDYLEFGVFTGSSFNFAMRIHRQLRFLGDIKTRFLGFDSFSGFGKVSAEDRHPFYLDTIFAVNEAKVVKNIKKHARGCETQIVKGYFEDTIRDKTARDFKVEKARIVFIDCDLKEPAKLVLEFVRPAIQLGTILVMDDFFSYKGDQTRGISGAFEEFCAKYPTIKWRRILDYGYGGIAYIASQV